MPIHDWTRVSAGIFHHFHQKWVGTIADALNEGLLPVPPRWRSVLEGGV
jgi:hypothetical protein